MDSSRRPGAGPGGYDILKNHAFFKGIDWKNLRKGTTPPTLALEPRDHSTSPSEDHDSSRNPSHVGYGSARTDDGNGSAASAVRVSRLASIDSFDSKWQQFLEPGESVLMISLVKKLQKLASKKVQLILTDKPKLIYVDPAKLEIRGNITWSNNPNDLSFQVMSPSNFKIFTVSHSLFSAR